MGFSLSAAAWPLLQQYPGHRFQTGLAGTCDAFEAAFREASTLIASMPGDHSHELRRCLEAPSRYLLPVHWQRPEDQTVGFQPSAEYQRRRALRPRFYHPFPTVEHDEATAL